MALEAGRLSSDMGRDEKDGGFELVDHTSEVTLRLHAPTFAGLFVQATLGFLSLVPERCRGRRRDVWRDFELDEGDGASTLVAWVNELVFHGEAELWIPCDVELEPDGASGVRIRARVLELDEPFVKVKAATLHDAEIGSHDDGISVDVTLDI